MDTLLTSLSINFSSHRSSREFHRPKSHLPSHPHLANTAATTTHKRTSISGRRTSLIHKNYNTPFPPSESPSRIAHQKPATGYAAALVDISQSNNSIQLIQRDIQRFSKLLHNNRIRALLTSPFTTETQKGQLVNQLASQGNFHKHLVGILKMLIEKGKLGIIQDMFDEFERIYDELIGTQMVFVSSAKKMEKDELFGIAKRVQRLSGAMKVKVSNLIDESSPSFAV